jgi:hypothetical protein
MNMSMNVHMKTAETVEFKGSATHMDYSTGTSEDYAVVHMEVDHDVITLFVNLEQIEELQKALSKAKRELKKLQSVE